MNRRIFLRNTAIITGGSLLFQKSALAQLFNVADFKITMLRKNVGIFTEKGGTIGFWLSPEGVVVIDAQFPDSSNHLVEDLKTRSTLPLKYLLNTHHHRDHTSGNINFKGLVQNIVAHENSALNQRNAAVKNNTLEQQVFPDMLFKDEWKLKMGDEKLKADYFGPAHTNGDAVYFFEEANIFHIGDLMFNKRHPVVDRSAGASISNWIKVLDKIIGKAEKDSLIIFGHSLNPGEETGNIEDLKKFQVYLQQVLDFAAKAVKDGITKEEFIKNTSIPGNTLWSGQGIERPLTAAYEEVMAGR